MVDYSVLNMSKKSKKEYISLLKKELFPVIGNNVKYDNGSFILNDNKIFNKNHWVAYNNHIYQVNKKIPRTITVYLQKYRWLMFKFQKNKRAPENWKNFDTRPSDDAVFGWKELFAKSSPDMSGVYFNKGHLIGAKLLPYATRFKIERSLNFVPLTNWANRANSKLAKGMHFFENELLGWLKELSSSEKIFYRVTPIFFDTDLIPRGIVVEGKLINSSNTKVHSTKIKETEFNVLIPNTQNNLKIKYKNPTGYKII